MDNKNLRYQSLDASKNIRGHERIKNFHTLISALTAGALKTEKEACIIMAMQGKTFCKNKVVEYPDI